MSRTTLIVIAVAGITGAALIAPARLDAVALTGEDGLIRSRGR
jgi:hypothetical protein